MLFHSKVLFRSKDIAQQYVRHDSFSQGTWSSDMWDMSVALWTVQHFNLRDMTHSTCEARILHRVRHDSLTMWDMTHSPCGTWLNLWDNTLWTCETWLIHVTHSNLIERNPPPRGGFLFTMFPHQEPCVRGPPSKDLYHVLRGGSSYTRFLMREHSN